ncbi:MAG: hypothetical protein JWN40_5017 [Phycisphaerales bacterium]|nr:hypothetical protein [Phycisphaerales bacterium]
MRFKSRFFVAALCGMALFGLSREVRANTIVLGLDSITSNAVGSFARFQYTAMLGGNSTITAGSYFVIYDFNGFAGFDNTFGSSVFTFGNWAATISGVGPYPTGDGTATGTLLVRTPSTDTGLLNLVFTYTGPSITNASPNTTNLITVTALSGVNTSTAGTYGSQDRASSTQLLQGSVQGVDVPAAGGPGDFLPTPAAACGGLVLLGLLGSKRSRKQVAVA